MAKKKTDGGVFAVLIDLERISWPRENVTPISLPLCFKFTYEVNPKFHVS